MSAQCRHGLIRYECWKCRDEANQETHVAHVFAGSEGGVMITLSEAMAEVTRLTAEVERLRSERYEMIQSRDDWQAIAARRIASLEQYSRRAENDIAELAHERDNAVRIAQDNAGEIEKLKNDLATARDGWHKANGTADLAMKHRDRAEADLAAAKALLPGVYYTDTPDGGDVDLIDQLRRMANDAERYRWLREHLPPGIINDCVVDDTASWGAAIDAALAVEKI